jgi:hypothetical protein
MTREEFIELLDKLKVSYEIEDDRIIVTGGDADGDIPFGQFWNLSSNVEFRNKGYVALNNLKKLPQGIVFRNGNDVYLRDLQNLPSGFEFNNKRDVNLGSIKTIPSDVKFNNGGDVYLPRILVGGRWFSEWSGHIYEINDGRLLNLMVKKGLFI